MQITDVRVRRIEKEGKAYAEKLRAEMKTEEAHRVGQQIKELKEQLLELGVSINAVNLESYIRYFYQSLSSFLEVFPVEQSVVFVDEPIRVKEHADVIEMEFRESMMHRVEKGYILPGQMDVLFRGEEIAAKLAGRRTVAISMMDGRNPLFKTEKQFDIQVRSMPSYNNSFDALVKDLTRYKKNGYRVLLLSGSRTRAKRLAEDLREQELAAFYSEDPEREVLPGEVMTYYGRVLKGFEYPLLKFLVISESDIFGSQKKK